MAKRTPADRRALRGEADKLAAAGVKPATKTGKRGLPIGDVFIPAVRVPDGATFICSRREPGEGPPIPLSTEGVCSDCGHAVWLAPSSQVEMRAKRLTLVCIECFWRLHGPKT